jgi:hypothetical protein
MKKMKHCIEATVEQVQTLAALGLTLPECRQIMETGTLLATIFEEDRVREFWIFSQGGVEVFEMKGKFKNISEKFSGKVELF